MFGPVGHPDAGDLESLGIINRTIRNAKLAISGTHISSTIPTLTPTEMVLLL